MKPRSAKNKGRLLQNWLRDTIYKYHDDLKQGDVRSTSSGVTGEDVQLSPAARRRIPFQFECKSKSAISVYGFYDQASEHGDFEPVVIVKQNGRDPLAVLSADKFIKLTKELYDNNTNKKE